MPLLVSSKYLRFMSCQAYSISEDRCQRIAIQEASHEAGKGEQCFLEGSVKMSEVASSEAGGMH